MNKFLALSAALGLIVLTAPGASADSKTASPEEKALQQRAREFVAAFNKGNAGAVAAFWAPDGDFMDVDGHCLKGRKAIEETYSKWFAENPGAKMLMTVTSLRVVSGYGAYGGAYHYGYGTAATPYGGVSVSGGGYHYAPSYYGGAYGGGVRYGYGYRY